MTLKRLGPYRLLELLARGRCEVYAADNTATGQRVAVKILPQRNVPEDLRDRLQRDMAVALQLPEFHIVAIDRWGEIDGQFYLQMPLVDGIDLQTLVDRDGPLSPADAVDIVGQIAEALDAAHAAGLVHSGVAPENILVTKDGTAYLMGFGYRAFLAGCEAEDDVLDSDPRLEKRHIGWCPERFSRRELTDRADTYGLARVLYACLTGVVWHRGRDTGEVIAEILAGTPPPSKSRSAIPRALDDVVARGMANDPAGRYPSSGELARAAREALAGNASSGADEQFGQYRLIRRVADGRCRVYEAQDHATGNRVAVKIFPPGACDAVTSKRVRREAGIVARLLGPANEPHVVPVRDVGEIDGRLYLQMPFIDGADLQSLLAGGQVACS